MSIQNVNLTDIERALGPDQAADRRRLERGPRKVQDMLDFSLLFFANRESVDPTGAYELLLESGQFADASGFRALCRTRSGSRRTRPSSTTCRVAGSTWPSPPAGTPTISSSHRSATRIGGNRPWTPSISSSRCGRATLRFG